MDSFRTLIIQELKALWHNDPTIHSVLEGGSAATGYLDDYSDLDLGVVCDDDAIEQTFANLEKFLANNHPVKTQYRVPEPSPHGHPQRFYILESSPPYFYLDVLVQKLSSPGSMIETDRHGTMIVWFDKTGQIELGPSLQEDVRKRGEAIFESIPGSFEIFAIEVKKNVARGHLSDAMVFYNSLLMRHLAPALNLKYRPAQPDFGIRYAWRAFPPDIAELCIDLMMVRDQKDLKTKLEAVSTLFHSLIDELRPIWGK